MEQKRLIKELNQGKNLAEQLMKHMNPFPSSNNSLETRQFLVEKILSSYEKALLMLNSAAAAHSAAAAAHLVISTTEAEAEAANNITLGSPHSPLANYSPRSEISDQNSKDQCYRNVFKKRKTTQPKWTEQVQVCSRTGLEGPLDDGHSWRKYGQKDILGANYPRGYYRCTHRPSQGCLATKQVQRSDQDPSIFEITYRGRHTCMVMAQASSPKLENGPKGPKQSKKKEVIHNFGGQELKEEKIKADEDDVIFHTFSFPCASENEIINNNNNSSIFNETLIMDDDVNFLGDISPTFLSPTTSGQSNYFCHQNLTSFVQTPESGLSEIISAPTSVTNSPIGDWDFSIDKVDFDPDLSFDNLEFFG